MVIGRVDCPSVEKQSPESVIFETNPSCFGTYEVGVCESHYNICGKNEKCYYATAYPVVETKDDLGGIAEPEPQNGITEGAEYIPLSNSTNEEIGRYKQSVKTSLTIIRNMYVEQANMDFRTWVKMLMEGM